MTRIPIYQPDLSGNERKYLLECLDSTWISSKGQFIRDFETAFAAYTGTAHAISVCNGTVALHLALLALGIGPGDEVIVPSFTYVASANAISYVGAKVVFADSRPDTWQVDVDHVESLIGPRTRCVMAVHLYGGAADVNRLRALCEARGIFLVEDSAEAFGTRVGGIHAGTFGDIGTFSFFGNKTLTTGEGGMVVCNDDALARRIRHLRSQGVSPDREYWHDVIGYNYRMTNLCAAIGLAQLERADAILQAKAHLAQRYREALALVPLSFQQIAPGETPSYWMITAVVHDASLRDVARTELARVGIETRPSFPPVHTMPMYAGPDHAALPVATDLAERGISFPSWHGLPITEITLIKSELSRVLGSPL